MDRKIGDNSDRNIFSNPSKSLAHPVDVTTHWEYGIQRETCNIKTGSWGNWGPWGGCTASCAGGLRPRYRPCLDANGDPITIGKRDCDCPGSNKEETDCNTFCCPVWHVCSGNNCNDNQVNIYSFTVKVVY